MADVESSQFSSRHARHRNRSESIQILCPTLTLSPMRDLHTRRRLVGYLFQWCQNNMLQIYYDKTGMWDCLKWTVKTLDFDEGGLALTPWDSWLPVPGESEPDPFQHILYYWFIVLPSGGIDNPASLGSDARPELTTARRWRRFGTNLPHSFRIYVCEYIWAWPDSVSLVFVGLMHRY